MKIRGGHVVPLLAIGGEPLDGRKKMAKQVARRLANMPRAELPDAFKTEFFIMNVARVALSVKKSIESPGSSCNKSSS